MKNLSFSWALKSSFIVPFESNFSRYGSVSIKENQNFEKLGSVWHKQEPEPGF